MGDHVARTLRMTRSRRILLLTCAAALVPGAALAAVVEYDNGQLRLADDPGAATSLSVSSTDAAVVFEGAGLRTEASRCVAVPTGISCERSGIVRLVVSLGDGDDTVSYTAQIVSPARVEGGLGDDKLTGGRGGEQLTGGPGNDSLAGGAGDDNLSGGDGRDTIRTGSGTNNALGGAGNDRLRGAAGIDRLFGGAGRDQIDGGRGNDQIHGEDGADRLTGGTGRDTLFGGDGRDRIDAGTGNDTIEAADGERDTIRCGKGRDTVTYDRRDRLSRDCERRFRRVG